MKWRLRRGGSNSSAGINLTPVPNADDPNHQRIVLQGADDSIISHPVFPEITQRALQPLADFPGIVQLLDPAPQKFRDLLGDRFVELAELLEGVAREINLPSHRAASLFPAERSCFVRSGSLPALSARSRCLPGHPNIEGSLRERNMFWCVRFAWRGVRGAFRFFRAGGWLAWGHRKCYTIIAVCEREGG